MLKLKIVTPQGVVYEDDTVEMLTVDTVAGVITIKDDHVPLVSLVKPGEINIHKEDYLIDLAVSSGVLEIRKDSEIFILADTAERGEHIDIERAEEARKRAEEYLKQQENIADVDFAKIQSQIETELAKISLGKKYRKISSTPSINE